MPLNLRRAKIAGQGYKFRSLAQVLAGFVC